MSDTFVDFFGIFLSASLIIFIILDSKFGKKKHKHHNMSKEAEEEKRQEIREKKEKVLENVPEECYCECTFPNRITTVFPLPDICDYCRKAIKP